MLKVTYVLFSFCTLFGSSVQNETFDRRQPGILPLFDSPFIKFCFYTRAHPLHCRPLYSHMPHVGLLDNCIGLKFILHGFMEYDFSIWVQDMKDELLRNDKFCVITVDWRLLASPPYSVNNVKTVASEIFNLLNTFYTKTYITPKDVHLIGHSLGAQISGFVGLYHTHSRIGKLGRISGLDPARKKFEGVTNNNKLDAGDADFVDIIHSDIRTYGIKEAVGHIDFYPNGGWGQPGCNKSLWTIWQETGGSVYHAVRLFAMCDHLWSLDFYISTINSNCTFLATDCPKFFRNRCSPGKEYKAGFPSTPQGLVGAVFIKTKSIVPFC